MNLPAELLAEAQAATGKNVTETVRLGLEELRRRQAFEGLRRLRGKVRFSMTWQEMKGDYD